MTSRYEALTVFLMSQREDVVEIPFSRLDEIVGGLPTSARKYQAWWANGQKSHAHASSWVNAGRIASPQFSVGTVRFSKVGPPLQLRPAILKPLDHRESQISRIDLETSSQTFTPMARRRSEGQPRRIGLVGCVKTKATVAMPAQDLYLSTLFKGRREFVERSCDEWWILSALHGLVNPLTVISPYDVALKGASSAERRRWAEFVLESISNFIKPVPGETFEFHAGADYRNFGLDQGLRSRGCSVENPTEGLSQGRQVSFYQGVQWT